MSMVRMLGYLLLKNIKYIWFNQVIGEYARFCAISEQIEKGEYFQGGIRLESRLPLIISAE
jgi:hypothetical protein